MPTPGWTASEMTFALNRPVIANGKILVSGERTFISSLVNTDVKCTAVQVTSDHQAIKQNLEAHLAGVRISCIANWGDLIANYTM